MRDFRDLAKALEEDVPAMDDLAKARVEKALLTQPRRAPSPERGHGFRAGVVVGLAAAAAVGIAVWAFPAGDDSNVAQVQVLVDGVPERTTEINEGETVVTSEAQALQVRFGGSSIGDTCLVEVEPASRVTFDGLDGLDHMLRLDRGSVHVEFHPDQPGEEGMVVQTPDARVVVVGTVFEVRATHDGTVVRVNEGRVRVEVEGREPAFVSAGEVLHVTKEQLAVEPTSEVVDVEPEVVVEVPPLQEAEAGEELSRRPVRRSEGTLEAPTRTVDDEVEVVAENTPVTVEDTSALDRVRPRQPVEPPIPLSDDARFDLARQLFDTEQLTAARHELYAIARSTTSVRARARAWTLVAETYERQSDVGRAIEAYRRAAQSGRTHDASDALFALARLRVANGEVAAGKAAYREYLQVAPDGALASTVRRALCRLGERAHCAE
ncbi:MAG: ferric-dicitrate binding protein FerR (iron transport regulator)/TolA-binding protein [Polyangiales bacterium]|jgi:ferric-dicitrate binding protein FerR (iron transport regulator)/TolA-binding protein